MSFRTVSAILRGRWLINKQYAETHLPLVLSILNKNGLDAQVDRTGNQQVEMPFAIDPKTMQRYEIFRNQSAPAGSVAILPISGPILKYNGDCGEAGSIQRVTWLNQIKRMDEIRSVVMVIDSPGGQVDGTGSLVNAILDLKKTKPVVGFVDDGIAASAAMWILSACSEAYAGMASDEVGSIGVYTTMMDFSGFFEMNGVKVHEIYAPQSTDKNKSYRDAMQGNYDLITADLQDTAARFISSVTANRPKAAAHQAEWSTGKMYNANEATKLGLIDGILTLDKAISKAAWLASRNK